jgi:2-methylisocitrate lyase-like PEP mutase family enzyme
VIVARTDARAPLGMNESIARAQRYAAIGADLIFVEAPQSVEEIEQIAATVNAPLLINIVPGGLTPELGGARLAELGYRVAIHPGAVLGPVAKATVDALTALRGRSVGVTTSADPAGFFDLFGLTGWNELGQRYRDHDTHGESS